MKLRAYIVALHAALFAILLAATPAGSGSMTLLGAGKAPGAASTPVVFDAASAVQSGASVSTLSWTHTPVGTPTAVAVGLYYFVGTAISSITYGGVSMTQAVNVNDTSGDNASIWGLANPLAGAQTVLITFVGGGNFATAGSVTVTGSSTSTVFRNTASNSGNSNAISSTVTSNANDLVVDFGGQDPAGSATTFTATGPNTKRWDGFASGASGIGGTSPGSASVTPSYSSSATQPWAHVSASFQAGP